MDKYLWAIRIFKTRSQAVASIKAGKVKMNGLPVKAGKHISIGERYEIKTEARKWMIEVSGLLDQRLQFNEAVKFYTDHSPVEESLPKSESAFVEYTGKRRSKQGRPTKRNRRDLGSIFEV